MTEYKDAIEKALNCTIEHLEGEHEGKVVVDREVFETLYNIVERLMQDPSERMAGFINRAFDLHPADRTSTIFAFKAMRDQLLSEVNNDDA